jgi:hypothetical protein
VSEDILEVHSSITLGECGDRNERYRGSMLDPPGRSDLRDRLGTDAAG